MKKLLIWLLVFTMFLGSIPSFAADGDIIHTGLKKIYRAEDTDALLNDVTNNISNEAFLRQFYREQTVGGVVKYVNVVDEEEEHLKYLGSLIDKGVKPEELAQYIIDNADTTLDNITTEIAIPFDEITDSNKGKIEDYKGNTDALKLKNPDNYSTPVLGVGDNTTRIMKLNRPSGIGATKWMYKVVDAPANLKPNDVVVGQTYTAQADITISEGKYILLCATDSTDKVKAYANIAVTADMIKKPKVVVIPDNSITATFTASTRKSGATVVSDIGEGAWKLAVLDTPISIVYEDSKFAGSVNYVSGMEIVAANEAEQDNMSDDFKKDIIVYSEKDGKIEKYKIFNVGVDGISGALDAGKLVVEDNYSVPVPGNDANATRIMTLDGLDIFSANKWMYVVRDNTITPKLNRVVKDSVDYQAGGDIKINPNQHLILLATNKDGGVRAYASIEVDADDIKNPTAIELSLGNHYKAPVKGNPAGNTKFEYLNYTGISNWKYVISEEDINKPELNSTLVGGTDFTLTNDISGDLVIVNDVAKLKAENFTRYMMVYGLDSTNKVQVFKKFVMDDSNVRMPKADDLTNTHYSGIGKGNGSNTTRITSLNNIGQIKSYRYKLIDNGTLNIEYNEVISDTIPVRENVDFKTTIGKHLLLLGVDNNNKIKAYETVELTFDNVNAGPATPLVERTNYQGPVPGDSNGSTKFTFLNPPTGATKFVYKIGDNTFGTIESGTEVTIGVGEYTEITANTDITGVAVDKYLLLVTVGDDNKIIGAKEFPRLSDNQIKGNVATVLPNAVHSFVKGDKPSTTKLKLEVLGLENPNSIVWRYKLVDEEPIDLKEKPYFNQVLEGITSYTVNGITKIGPDITVGKTGDTDKPYGYILLLATDSGNRTKGYKYIEIDEGFVKEHAPEITVTGYKDGTKVDSVNFDGLAVGTYRYLISNTKPQTPAIGDTLPSGVVDYNGSDDIVIQIGKYLTLYEVDGNKKIQKCKTFFIEKVKQGAATLSSNTLLEGSIRSGGSSFTVELTNDAKWANVNDKSIRDKFFHGFKADKESSEWTKVIASMIADGVGAIALKDNVLTIMLPQTLNYDIKEEQTISLVIPPEAIDGAINPINATGRIVIKPTIGATISGDVVSSIVRQADIKAGGKTIVVELTDGTWAGNVNGIINHFSSSSNWNIIKNSTGMKIVRNSGTKVTITLPAVDVNFGISSEVISLTIPRDPELVVGATEDIVASPNFTLYPDILQIIGEAGTDKVVLMAPDYKTVDTNNATWTIKVTTGTLKDSISSSDVVISGLPKGLVANINQEGTNTIKIQITGTASATMASELVMVKVKIKGSAVTEPNSVDSAEIGLNLVKGDSLIEDLKKVTVDVLGGILKDETGNQLNSDKIEFSLDSTTGTNGDDWTTATEINTKNITFKAGKVYVREKRQSKGIQSSNYLD